MTLPCEYLKKVKWSIYEWVGTLSVDEIETNKDLQILITNLFKALRFVNAPVGENSIESRTAH